MDTVIVLARSRSYAGKWVMTGRLDSRLDTPPLSTREPLKESYTHEQDFCQHPALPVAVCG